MKRKQNLAVFLREVAAVLAVFKRLGEGDRGPAFLAVRCDQFLAEPIRELFVPGFVPLREPLASLLLGVGNLVEQSDVVGQPLVHLGLVLVEHVELRPHRVVDVDHHVGIERGGLPEVVREVTDHGVVREVGRLGADIWYCHHVGGVLDQPGGVSVVGVVIVRPVGEHEVGFDLTNELDHVVAVVDRGFEFALRIVEGDVLRTDDRGGRVGLRTTSSSERRAALFVVAGLAVGHADVRHLVAALAVLRGRPTETNLAVVEVCANDEYRK